MSRGHRKKVDNLNKKQLHNVTKTLLIQYKELEKYIDYIETTFPYVDIVALKNVSVCLQSILEKDLNTPTD